MRSGRRGWRVAAAVVSVAMAMTACGGADAGGDGDGGESGDAVSWDDGPASLGILEPGVDVADEPADVDAAEFRTGEDGEGLVVSDLVRTDDAGFAEVRWVEGALARIDVGTVFEVTELDLETGQPKVSARLEVGRVWSRLDAGVAEYEVATDVGTAAVRGTGFLVGCTPDCTFGVAEGALRLVTVLGIELDLRAGEQVAVDEGGTPGAIEPFDLDDAWVQANIDLDGDLGFPAIEPSDPGDDGDRGQLARGRMETSYQFAFTVEQSTQSELEGQAVERTWVFFPECDEGPCGGEWDPGDGNRERFEWTGQGYTASWVDRPAGECPDGSPRWAEDFVLVMTPTELFDTNGVVRTLDARWESTLTPLPAAVESGCDAGEGPVDQVLVGTGEFFD